MELVLLLIALTNNSHNMSMLVTSVGLEIRNSVFSLTSAMLTETWSSQ